MIDKLKANVWMVLALVAGLLLGVQTWRLHSAETTLAKTLQAHAVTLKGISDLAAAASEKANASMVAAMRAAAAFDSQRSKEKDDALLKIEADRAAVARGDSRLRVAATCRPASGGDVPKRPASASVDAEAAPRLDADAEQNYFRLAEQIVEVTAQLRYLQDRATLREKFD